MRESVSLAIVGSGGAGALTTGGLLLEAASAGGWQGLLARTVGPQIRGGLHVMHLAAVAPARLH